MILRFLSVGCNIPIFMSINIPAFHVLLSCDCQCKFFFINPVIVYYYFLKQRQVLILKGRLSGHLIIRSHKRRLRISFKVRSSTITIFTSLAWETLDVHGAKLNETCKYLQEARVVDSLTWTCAVFDLSLYEK